MMVVSKMLSQVILSSKIHSELSTFCSERMSTSLVKAHAGSCVALNCRVWKMLHHNHCKYMIHDPFVKHEHLATHVTRKFGLIGGRYAREPLGIVDSRVRSSVLHRRVDVCEG